MSKFSLKYQTPLSILLILVAGISVYYHTLDVPFYLDDISSIADNSAIKDLGNFKALWEFSGLRFIGYFTFALNYYLHGVELAGYHLVNISIHLMMSIVVYLFVAKLEKISNQYQTSIVRIQYLPILVALIYVLHPLNTQAVTYIVQRLASLTALLYLSSMLFYLYARSAQSMRGRWGFALLVCLSGGAALFTKQNAFTLPFAFLLVEYCFFHDYWRAKKMRLQVLASGLLVLGVGVVALFISTDILTEKLLDTETIGRLEYFNAQVMVVWKYIGLAMWPYPLNLDYGVNLNDAVFSETTLVALLGHILALVFAFVIVQKQPLITFGILFYYLALSIESSFIPIRDFMVEHRTYLPNVGLILVMCVLLLFPGKIATPLRVFVIAALLIFSGILTWERNNLWRDQIAFYHDSIDSSPDQSRNWVALSQSYFKQSRDAEALSLLREELRENRSKNKGVLNEPLYVIAFWSQLLRANGYEEKADKVELTYKLNSDTGTRQRLLLERGNTALVAGNYTKAVKLYEEVLAINPRHENAQVNIGVIALMEGRLDEAESTFRKFPANPVAKANIDLLVEMREGSLSVNSVERKVFFKKQ